MTKISNLQSKFVDEYIIDLNPVNAAIRAGYSKDYAHAQAHKLLLNKNIKLNIAGKINQNAQNLIFTKGFFAFMLLKILDYSSSLDEISDKNGNATGEFKMKDISAALKSLDCLSKICDNTSPKSHSFNAIEVENLDISLI
ncbi:MAG: terminase small subunit [Candidatus Gastranaerophilales bacterium]|nr:terminase small subunit [Candidatus Gastranaerophilales bacterium]